MEEGLRPASDPTIKLLLLFPGVGWLVKGAAVFVYYPNHLQVPRCWSTRRDPSGG
jgi:hypothetical protein